MFRRPARRAVHRHQRHVEDADPERLPAAGLPDRPAGPTGWTSDHFDVVAKAEGGAEPWRSFPRRETGRAEPRAADAARAARGAVQARRPTTRRIARFQSTHWCSHARDGKLGPQLHKSEADCDADVSGGSGSGTDAAAGGPPQPAVVRFRAGFGSAPGNMVVGGSTLGQFANTLAMFVGRVVVDRTGLAGAYDFNLTWTPDNMPMRPRRRARGAGSIQTDRRSSPRCRNSSGSSSIRRRARSASS